ncbi:DUF5999 family protein [Streptomyces yaizuensis]|uniref:DUF5999 family protein n=1 Tax=Streptomyces yaizuensis TaxID=2989713 RepID=A0ABQ5P6C0_9ACTN|nr:DUF5999 family protein [Streptomyces sp. YSPA8]GLF98134.1 DUF5999 family protein [Streptomyces sp. YSPA8]
MTGPACPHTPPCPEPDAKNGANAHTVTCNTVQGWVLLCNGVLLFDDTGALLPDGQIIAPHRPTGTRQVAA